jgi:hypothetical protein
MAIHGIVVYFLSLVLAEWQVLNTQRFDDEASVQPLLYTASGHDIGNKLKFILTTLSITTPSIMPFNITINKLQHWA